MGVAQGGVQDAGKVDVLCRVIAVVGCEEERSSGGVRSKVVTTIGGGPKERLEGRWGDNEVGNGWSVVDPKGDDVVRGKTQEVDETLANWWMEGGGISTFESYRTREGGIVALVVPDDVWVGSGGSLGASVEMTLEWRRWGGRRRGQV